MFTKENVTHTKIGYALKTVESKFWLHACEGTSALFCEMFPDSKIAHSFSLSRTKRKSYSSEVVHHLRGVFL